MDESIANSFSYGNGVASILSKDDFANNFKYQLLFKRLKAITDNNRSNQLFSKIMKNDRLQVYLNKYQKVKGQDMLTSQNYEVESCNNQQIQQENCHTILGLDIADTEPLQKQIKRRILTKKLLTANASNINDDSQYSNQDNFPQQEQLVKNFSNLLFDRQQQFTNQYSQIGFKNLDYELSNYENIQDGKDVSKKSLVEQFIYHKRQNSSMVYMKNSHVSSISEMKRVNNKIQNQQSNYPDNIKKLLNEISHNTQNIKNTNTYYQDYFDQKYHSPQKTPKFSSIFIEHKQQVQEIKEKNSFINEVFKKSSNDFNLQNLPNLPKINQNRYQNMTGRKQILRNELQQFSKNISELNRFDNQLNMADTYNQKQHQQIRYFQTNKNSVSTKFKSFDNTRRQNYVKDTPIITTQNNQALNKIMNIHQNKSQRNYQPIELNIIQNKSNYDRATLSDINKLHRLIQKRDKLQVYKSNQNKASIRVNTGFQSNTSLNKFINS